MCTEFKSNKVESKFFRKNQQIKIQILIKEGESK